MYRELPGYAPWKEALADFLAAGDPWPPKPVSVRAGRHVAMRSSGIRSRPSVSSPILPRERHLEGESDALCDDVASEASTYHFALKQFDEYPEMAISYYGRSCIYRGA